ncbi:hypothetical protein BGX33_008106 [Mortierella sp. NVP41]|nr:hypothetical protein BGX33_008106 [Mortierella sp. NVP41]
MIQPPRGMHRHQLSFDGHVAPPVDLQFLSAQLQQRQQQQQQQHLQEQIQLQKQQQDMMAAAVMASVQQGVLTPVDSSITNMMVPTMTQVHPVNNMQDLGAMSAPTVNPHLMSGVSQQHKQQQQQQHQQAPQQQPGLPMQIKIEPGLVSHPSMRSAGPNTPSEMGYPTPISSVEGMTTFTPMVPSMQPLPISATTSPTYTPPEGVIASLADPSKRHRRHPSSGHHSPELRIMFQKQEFLQQQQQKMAAKEQVLFESIRRVEVEPHQTRSPRAAAAAGLKINVADIQARAMPPMSALVSPNESGHIYSPGPLSGLSPTMGPVSNSLMDTIMEVSSNFQLQNLEDPKPAFPVQETKVESMEVLEPPSTRSELAELSKQELIEKVMEYERQMEGSLPTRRMSNAKAETAPSDITVDMPAITQPVASPQQQHLQQQPQSQILTFSPTPSVVSLSTPAPCALEARATNVVERKSTSPPPAPKALTSPATAPAPVPAPASTQNDEEDDEEEGDEEEDEDDMDDDDNEDDADGDKAAPRPTKQRGTSSANMADDADPPLQLVCLWRDCNTPFETMAQLNDHVTEQHIGSGKACYSCDWQGCHRKQKPFTKRHKMYNHLRTHTGERPFRCLVPGCEKKFSRPDSLTTHTKTHSNIRPYVCPVEGCPKAYYHARSLKKHELAHETKRGGNPRALRGPGNNAAAQSSSGDASSSTTSVSTSAAAPPQQQQYSHFNHPYHPDFTSGLGRATKHHGHQRQLSQSAGFNLTLTSDPCVASGLLSAGSVSAGTNSPSPGPMGPGQGFNAGFTPSMTIIKPSLSSHSSTSSVPSLSMVMSNASLGSIDGQSAMGSNPAYHHQQHQQSHGQAVHGIPMSSTNSSHQTTPAGSPGFQSAAVPSSALTGPPTGANTIVPLPMPMSMPMPMQMGMGMQMNPVGLQGVSSPPPPMPAMPAMPAMHLVHPQGGLETVAPSTMNGNNLYTMMPAGANGGVVPPAGMMSGMEVPVSTSVPGPHLSPAGSEPGSNGVPIVLHPM